MDGYVPSRNSSCSHRSSSRSCSAKSSTVCRSMPAAPFFPSTLCAEQKRFNSSNTLSISVCHLPSHLVGQKCRQHAFRPNRRMSPPGNARYLSDRGSRERHCDRDVISPGSGFVTVTRFGHLASTFLFPFAPPRFAARLHRYYENSDPCRTLQPVRTDVATSLPLVDHDILPTGPGPFRMERSPLPYLTTQTVHGLSPTDLPAYLV